MIHEWEYVYLEVTTVGFRKKKMFSIHELETESNLRKPPEREGVPF
jgi:hypothetical protein